MNILFLTVLDFKSLDEYGIYTDLISQFVKEKHFVHVVSPIERRKKIKTHIISKKEYTILKLKIGNFQKTNAIEKGITMLALESRLKRAIKKYYADVKFDLIIFSTPPITFRKTVKFIKQRDNAKTYLLLKDIFPQNAVDLGFFNKGWIYKLILAHYKKIEKEIYQLADYIGCMSKANVKFLIENNDFINKDIVEVCPNSIEPRLISVNHQEMKDIKEMYGIPNDKVIFAYGGNIGKPQGIDFIIECLKDNKNHPQAYFVIIGSGTEFKKLQIAIKQNNISNVRMINQLENDQFLILLKCCDGGLIFLDYRFTIPNFPSRLLSYLQTSLPVLAATDTSSDIKEVIEEGKFGLWCASKDVSAFSDKLNQLCYSKSRKELGNNGRIYLENNYTAYQSYRIIMNHFIKK
jgi:glycosyltransferase involved in cell wall biosynthesis